MHKDYLIHRESILQGIILTSWKSARLTVITFKNLLWTSLKSLDSGNKFQDTLLTDPN